MRGDTSNLGFFREPHVLVDAEAGELRYSRQSDTKGLSVNRLGDRATKPTGESRGGIRKWLPSPFAEDGFAHIWIGANCSG